MQECPEAGVRRLGALLGISHPAISRRVSKLRRLGLVAHGPNGWEVEALSPPPASAQWVRPIGAYGRSALKLVDADEAGDDDEAPPRTRYSRRPKILDSRLRRYG
jgi:hypothetical protein